MQVFLSVNPCRDVVIEYIAGILALWPEHSLSGELSKGSLFSGFLSLLVISEMQESQVYDATYLPGD